MKGVAILLFFCQLTVFKATPVPDSDCKPEWYNKCKSNSECCSGYCDNKDGQWFYGLCRKNTEGSLHLRSSHFDKCQKDYQTACLKEHNNYRAIHQAPPLKTSVSLQTTSLKYAKNIAARDVLVHSNKKGVGENLAQLYNAEISKLTNCAVFAKKFVKMWYDEVSKYSYSNPVFSPATGHFTQVVWKSTRMVGCGVAMGKNGKVYGVSQYTAAGNIQGRFSDNVLPPETIIIERI